MCLWSQVLRRPRQEDCESSSLGNIPKKKARTIPKKGNKTKQNKTQLSSNHPETDLLKLCYRN